MGLTCSGYVGILIKCALVGCICQASKTRITYLVWHGGGADLAGDGALLKVADGDVRPDVAVKIDEDGVEALQCAKQLRIVVMWL